MEKGDSPGLFVNDGSFMEKFKQFQQEKQHNLGEVLVSSASADSPALPRDASLSSNKHLESKSASLKKSAASSSGGKLAFSLKQKSKVVMPAVRLGADEDEDEKDMNYESCEGPAKRQKSVQQSFSTPSHRQGDVVPSPPSDLVVKNVADKLASFVAKNGRQFEDITRQKNPGDTPFKFLFDSNCSDYKYYENRLLEEEKALLQTSEPQVPRTASNSVNPLKTSGGSQRHHAHKSSYQTPASALNDTSGARSGPSASDPIAMMEFYMKKAAQEERKRPPKYSKDEMPPPASLQVPTIKGHHMGDYIPPEELEKFLASCNDASTQKFAQEAAERAKIQADNVGHKLLSKMGWKEGEGLGSSKSGRADPVMAGSVKKDNLGVGAEQPGEVNPDDDIYEQYKKRMMLGYRYRPNPLNNPRKAYY